MSTVYKVNETSEVIRWGLTTMAVVTGKVRRFLNDLDPDNFRWSDADIWDAVGDAVMYLWQDRAIGSPGSSLKKVTMTYTGGEDDVALPTTVMNQGIFAVDDVGNPSTPIRILYVPPEALHHPVHTAYPWAAVGRRFTVLTQGNPVPVGDPSDDGFNSGGQPQRIAVRPVPGGDLTLAVWFISSGWYLTGAASQHPFAQEWNKLLALLAAIQMMDPLGETPDGLLRQYDEQMVLWRAHSGAFLGPQSIPQRRQGRTK